MKNQLKALVLSAVAFSSAAYAAVSTDLIEAGDIFIGFYAASGEGAGRNLIVNLGAYQQFDNRDGGSFSVTNVAIADLSGIYGADWNTRTDLVWTVTGFTSNTSVDGLTRNSVFASSPRVDIGNAPDAIASNNDSALALDRTNIETIKNLFNVTDTTANSTVSVNVDATHSQAFTNRQNANNTARFGPLGANDASGTNITDFYGLVPTSGGIAPAGNAAANGWTRGSNYLGTFTLDATGLTFTASTSAVPEPASFAALGGLVALGFAASRRRRSTHA